MNRKRRERKERVQMRLDNPGTPSEKGLRRKVKDGDFTPAQAIKMVTQLGYSNPVFIDWCKRRKK